MAFTKINAAGIGTTETVTVDGLTVINNGSFGGNLTVGGVLTYEDVTNVDSVGLITARNGIVVGSGITLSKDGDIFATGITTVSGNIKVGTGITLSPDGDVFFTGVGTGNGSGLTALNASNLASGTVPTARLGSGTASSSTFLRGDSTFQTVNTDLVADTSPQLGGDLDLNGNIISVGDGGSNANQEHIRFGDDGDLRIWHDGSNSYIKDTGTGILVIESNQLQIKNADADEKMIVADANGAVELYYDNSKKIETTSGGATVTGNLTATTNFRGNDNVALALGTGTDFRILHDGTDNVITCDGGQNLRLVNHLSGGNEDMIKCIPNGNTELYHNGSRKFRTVSDGCEINAAEGGDAVLSLIADEGDDNADYWRFLGGTAGQLDIASYSTGSWVNHLTIKPDGEVTKPNNPAASVYTNSSEQGGHSNEVSSGYIKNGGETFDRSNDHGYVSNIGRFTCPVDGLYRVSFFSNISVDGLTGDAFNINTTKNGGTVHLHYDQKDVTSWQYMTFSDLISCSANDYLQIYIKAGNGSSEGTIGVDGSNSQWNSTFYELVA